MHLDDKGNLKSNAVELIELLKQFTNDEEYHSGLLNNLDTDEDVAYMISYLKNMKSSYEDALLEALWVCELRKKYEWALDVYKIRFGEEYKGVLKWTR